MSSPTDLPAAPELPGPVTPARLRALAATAGYEVPEAAEEPEAPDGPDAALAAPHLRARWDGGALTATLLAEPGPTLLIRSRRSGAAIPAARRQDVAALVHDWHRSRVWPTLVPRDEGGQVAVIAHIGVDVEAGLTDAQLLDWLRLALGAVRSCFAEIDELLGLPPSSSTDPQAR